jgi:hypothetical protein
MPCKHLYQIPKTFYKGAVKFATHLDGFETHSIADVYLKMQFLARYMPNESVVKESLFPREHPHYLRTPWRRLEGGSLTW